MLVFEVCTTRAHAGILKRMSLCDRFGRGGRASARAHNEGLPVLWVVVIWRPSALWGGGRVAFPNARTFPPLGGVRD